MRIHLTIEPDAVEDIDFDSSTGLTRDAHDQLVDALADAGFGIVEGPTVEDDD